MIGMMYLVLTALLAMNVSKEVLMGFVTVNESLERTNKSFNESTSTMMKYFSDYVKKDPGEKYYYEKAVEAEKISGEMYMYIEELKKKLVQTTEDRTKEQADTSRLRFVSALDNYDVPTYELFGDDEANPSKTPFSAHELRTKLTETHDKILKLFEGEMIKKKFLPQDLEQLRKKIAIIKPADPLESHDNVKEDWQMANFYHLPLAAVITNLSKIQSDLKNVESETINTIAKSVMTTVPKIDQFAAAVVAPTNYIQTGETYRSEIFLAAGSSTVKREIFIGDFDSVTHTFRGEPQQLAIDANGRAVFEQPGNMQGDKVYKGVIKMTKETGEVEYYPFEQKFTVAPPSVAVSADYMNVVYAGIENPVTISAAGVASQNLRVSIDKGTITSAGGSGKFIIKASEPGKVTVTVSSTEGGVTKKQGQVTFRVKMLPKPSVKVSGKGGADNKVTKTICGQMNYVTAMPENFDLTIPYKVLEWEMLLKIGGQPLLFTGNGASLTTEAKNALKRVTPGSTIYMDVKAQSPDGRKHTESTKLIVQ